MAAPSITDLQSLVNRLTADNNRLRNLMKLYEATFAAMKPASTTSARMTAKSLALMHDVQFSQARLGTHPLRGADCSRFYNAVMREVQISAAMVDAARNALNNAIELRQIAETVW